MSAIICIAVAITMLFSGYSIKTDAATPKTKTIITTQECSIWTQPNTSEKYRQKKIPAGYQVTIIPKVVQSTKGDGKTFYKTVKGAYILCKCCDGNEAGSGNGTGNTNKSKTVIFGRYEQDGNLSNGPEPIEWDVLETRDGKTLLISHYVLDKVPYTKEIVPTIERPEGFYDVSVVANRVNSDLNWSSSYVRSWLNDSFYNKAFNDAEKAKIVPTSNATKILIDEIRRLANDTTEDVQRLEITDASVDKVFILSVDEALYYYGRQTDYYMLNNIAGDPKYPHITMTEKMVTPATAYATQNGVRSSRLGPMDAIAPNYSQKMIGQYIAMNRFRDLYIDMIDNMKYGYSYSNVSSRVMNTVGWVMFADPSGSTGGAGVRPVIWINN